jgi:hypothetical protein
LLTGLPRPRREGATLRSPTPVKLKDRVVDLAQEFSGGLILPCDVAR